MDQLGFFPPSAFTVTARLQLDGTWTATIGSSRDKHGGVTWVTETYESLSLGEVFDVVLAIVW